MSRDEDRRAHPRVAAPSYLRCVHVATSAALGRVGDISIGGFRLHAAAHADLGAAHQDRALRLEPCIEGVAQAPIHVVAALRWQRPDTQAGVVLAGFEFTRLSAAAVLQLDAFVQALRRLRDGDAPQEPSPRP
jgi:c-di-GMP-binding flagellar brake protein YcgR